MIKINITDRDIFKKIIEPIGIQLNSRIYTTPDDYYVFIDNNYRLTEDYMRMSWDISHFLTDPQYDHFVFHDQQTFKLTEVFNSDRVKRFKNVFLSEMKEYTPYYVEKNGKFLSDKPFILDDNLSVTLIGTNETYSLPYIFNGNMTFLTVEEYRKIPAENHTTN